MRHDLLVLAPWIKDGSRVLDLGCGDGELLQHLIDTRDVRGLGVEIDEANITTCIGKGLSVIEQDMDKGLTNFADNSFDTVLLTQTLQAVHRPDYVLQEMLRVGKECIISFPNFGHWQARWHLMLRGKMPVSKFMPYEWYDTPNIHFCTVKDFEALCQKQNIKVLNRTVQTAFASGGASPMWAVRQWPNFFGVHAIYHVTR